MNIKKVLTLTSLMSILAFALTQDEAAKLSAKRKQSSTYSKEISKKLRQSRRDSTVNALDRDVARSYVVIADTYAAIRNKVVTQGQHTYSAVCFSDYMPNVNDVLEAYWNARIGFNYVPTDDMKKALKGSFSFKYFQENKERFFGYTLDVENQEESLAKITKALEGSHWFTRAYGSMGQGELKLSADGKGTQSYLDSNVDVWLQREVTWTTSVYTRSENQKYALLTVTSEVNGQKVVEELVVSPYTLPYARESIQLIDALSLEDLGVDIYDAESVYTETDFPCDA